MALFSFFPYFLIYTKKKEKQKSFKQASLVEQSLTPNWLIHLNSVLHPSVKNLRIWRHANFGMPFATLEGSRQE